MSLPFFFFPLFELHDSSRAGWVSSVCVHTHECERSCGIKTNGNLQTLTLCFCFYNLLTVPLNTKYFWSSFNIYLLSSTLVFLHAAY